MSRLFLAFFTAFLSISSTVFSATSGPTYTLGSGSLSICADSSGVTASCPANFSCNIIPSSVDGSVTGVTGGSIGVCTPIGSQYCFVDNDCDGLGSPNCMQHSSILASFIPGDANGASGPVGICGTLGTGNSEDNIMADAMCKGVGLVTGKVGRGLVAVIIIFMGVLFFTGKISWNTILATALGAGALFGAPALVGVITGKPFICTRK